MNVEAVSGCGALGFPPCTTPTDLDRAMAICREHTHATGQIIATNPPSEEVIFDETWMKSCSRIEDKWNHSEAAKAEREAREQEQRDLEFVNRVAGEAK